MNENENHTVRLLLPESMGINLLALIGAGMTSHVCSDLGITPLYDELYKAFGHATLEGHSTILGRRDLDTPVTVTRRDERPRYTSIDLT
jgi:hypothetical protein